MVGTQARPFGLTTAPTVYPTHEEFANPYEYIKSLIDLGDKYGIVKLVPPSDWQPPFCLDPETFTFVPRVQNLSLMGLFTRATINWSRQLKQFHRQKSGVDIETDAILPGGIQINFYLLNYMVDAFGGYIKVCREELWPQVKQGIWGDADIDPQTLEKLYTSTALPFAEYAKLIKKSETFHILRLREEDQSANAIEDEDEEENCDSGDEKNDTTVACCICTQEVDDKVNIECRECSRSYHKFCIPSSMLVGDPVTSKVWWCPLCLTSPSAYQYDYSDEMTLSEYKVKSDKFKAEYIRKHMATPDPTGFDWEREFWTQVSDVSHPIEVEYGADLVSEKLGSGFPKGKHEGPYALDPWNLNNLGKIEPSLFRHLRKPISGVTSPWAYTGMLFSAFCWHAEDHFAYSINYQHAGATKTWYGIPARQAKKFERAGRLLVPEEFKADADVLSNRATLLPPEFIADNGIDVCVIDQQPGEFVITFPNAYHAGFNHGYNFNEAVNYVPPEWLPMGEESFQYYRLMKHEPAFCQEELLVRTFWNEKVEWVRKSVCQQLTDFLSMEMGLRDKIQKSKRLRNIYRKGVGLRYIEKDIDTAGYHCKVCKTIPFFSRFKDDSGTVPVYYCPQCVCDPTFSFPSRDMRYWSFEIVRDFSEVKIAELKEEIAAVMEKTAQVGEPHI